MAPPTGAQRAGRHTAVQTESGGADDRCVRGGRGGRGGGAVRRTRMLDLLKRRVCIFEVYPDLFSLDVFMKMNLFLNRS